MLLKPSNGHENLQSHPGKNQCLRWKYPQGRLSIDMMFSTEALQLSLHDEPLWYSVLLIYKILAFSEVWEGTGMEEKQSDPQHSSLVNYPSFPRSFVVI
jgi:hypothetical protein